MKESLLLSATFNAPPNEIYEAWLDGELHAKMTGGEASGEAKIGAAYTAWDGYIWGKNIELKPFEKIVQTWRTSEFDEADEDSHLLIQFTPKDGGTEVTLTHTNIPEGQTQYVEGWENHYFIPMREYFG